MGSMSVGRSGMREIKLTDGKGNHVGTVRVSKPKVKKKKRIQYNFREISGRILQTKTSGSAGRVLVSARAKVAMLQRMVRNPDYDEKELEQAIIHAKKMERIAKKKMKHLQEEEKAARTGSCSDDLEVYEEVKADAKEDMEEAEGGFSAEELEALVREYQATMQESMKELARDVVSAGMEELTDDLGLSVQKDMSHEDLERLKKKHRSDEMKEIAEADLKYLKALFDRLAKEKSEGAANVSLQLAGMEVPVEATTEAPVAAEGGNVDISI